MSVESLRFHGDRLVSDGVADHAVNVLAGGPPEWLMQGLAETLAGSELARYPDAARAERALAAGRGGGRRTPAEFVATNGAAEALWRLGPALAPRRAAVLYPGFTETEVGLRAHGIPVERHLDPASAAAGDADLIVVTNPASPTGELWPSETILALRAPGRTVVVDEAYLSLVPGEPGSFEADAPGDVIVVRSLTKVLAVPGLRVGYAVAAPALADRLRAAGPPWSANALALRALELAAAHPGDLAARTETANRHREDLEARLATVPGVRLPCRSVTNFVLAEVDDGPGVAASLLRRGFAVRPCGSFPGCGDHQLRITAREPEANARLIDALAEVLDRRAG